ncbi:hypothetical protein D3C78_1366310 [compost metagenome]
MIADDDPAFAADLGSGEYTADYFGKGRYSYACTGAHGHSIPIIGGKYQQAGSASKAKVIETSVGNKVDTLSLELAACYPDCQLTSYIRTFHWNKAETPNLELRDTIGFDNITQQIDEVFITKCVPEYIHDGQILLLGKRHSILLHFEAERYHTSIQQQQFINHFGQEERYYQIKITIHEEHASLENVMTFHFVFQMKERGCNLK